MASQKVKSALLTSDNSKLKPYRGQITREAVTEKMRTQERGSYPAKGAKVKAAMTPPKEERPQKQTKRVKNTRISGR